MQLKKTTIKDLETLFLFQLDEVSNQMAAFTPKDPQDKSAYLEKWSKIVQNPNILMQTIWLENEVVGSVIHFDMMNETNISYWVERKHWGQNIASDALKRFLEISDKRPLFARVAFDNFGSQKVLEKCGFSHIGNEHGFANARNKEIEELVYRLEK